MAEPLLLTQEVKLGLAAQLAFWRQQGRFPDDEADLAPAVVAHLAGQVGSGTDTLDGYDWAGRTGRRHRRMILDQLAVAPSTMTQRPCSAVG